MEELSFVLAFFEIYAQDILPVTVKIFDRMKQDYRLKQYSVLFRYIYLIIRPLFYLKLGQQLKLLSK